MTRYISTNPKEENRKQITITLSSGEYDIIDNIMRGTNTINSELIFKRSEIMGNLITATLKYNTPMYNIDGIEYKVGELYDLGIEDKELEYEREFSKLIEEEECLKQLQHRLIYVLKYGKQRER